VISGKGKKEKKNENEWKVKLFKLDKRK